MPCSASLDCPEYNRSSEPLQFPASFLGAIASRLQQIADYFNDGRKLIRTGQTKEQATPKVKAKAKPPSTKALIGALNEADREFADGLTPSDQGQAGMVLRSRCREEAWPMVARGDVSLDLAARVCQTEEDAGTSLTFEQLLWCWKAETKAGRAARKNGLQLGNRAEEFVRMVEEGVDEEAACEALNVRTECPHAPDADPREQVAAVTSASSC